MIQRRVKYQQTPTATPTSSWIIKIDSKPYYENNDDDDVRDKTFVHSSSTTRVRYDGSTNNTRRATTSSGQFSVNIFLLLGLGIIVVCTIYLNFRPIFTNQQQRNGSFSIGNRGYHHSSDKSWPWSTPSMWLPSIYPLFYTFNKNHHPHITNSNYGTNPRLVQFDFETNQATTKVHGKPIAIKKKARPVGHVISATNDQDKNNNDDDGTNDDDNDVCEPMYEWQTLSYVTCNPLHEYSFPREARNGAVKFIACGGDRCTFQINNHHHGGRDPSLALKVVKLRDGGGARFSKSMQESSRRDGMTMERLTQSPYVLSTYGYCGVSQLLEFADGGAVHDLIKRGRNFDFQIPPIDKLRIAIQLVTAVADLHTIDHDSVPSITHNDICCHQFVMVNGVYKLNDFHLSYFLQQRKISGDVCWRPMAVGERWQLMHAPEEGEEDIADNAKADDYVVGNVIYSMLTSQWVFESRSNHAKALRDLQRGLRPPFPPYIRDSADPAYRALMTAIHMTWTHNASDRPSSRAVSNYLIQQLEAITGEAFNNTKTEPVRVSLPPLPQNWNFAEDPSFDANFDD